MMNLFENLCNIKESHEENDIIKVKISGCAPSSEGSPEEEKDYREFVKNDYNLDIIDFGDVTPDIGYEVVQGSEEDVENYLSEIYGFDFDDDEVEIIESLDIKKEADLKTMSGADQFAWQGVENFPDGEKPMISEGKYGILVIGGTNGEENTITLSIYYGPDGNRWAWKSYNNKATAIKDAKIFSKLLDDEIDEIQLDRFGFEIC